MTDEPQDEPAEPYVGDVAREQFERSGCPTVVVPVQHDGLPAVFFASCTGDEEWMARASRSEHQADLAICCCMIAYAEAAGHGLLPRPVRAAP